MRIPRIEAASRSVCAIAKFIPGLLMLIAALPVAAQSIQYEVPEKKWDANLGTHRVVLKVAQPAEAVRAHLEWRRRDPRPAEKGVVVVDAKTGARVANTISLNVSAEAGDLIFQPTSGPGEYFAYFLPGNPGGGSFPKAKYLPPQDTAPADWKAKFAGDNWPRLPETKPVRWEARTEHDRFNEMEIIATTPDREAWLAKHPGNAQVFLESRERPVRMLDHVPEIWLKREKAPEFVARPGESFFFQAGVWAVSGDIEIVGVRGKIESLGEVRNSHELPVEPYLHSKTLTVPKGSVQPLWCWVDVPRDAKPGVYEGNVFVVRDAGGPLPIRITVAGEALAAGTDAGPASHSRLRWLGSEIGNEPSVPKPLVPLRVEGRTIHCLGRSVTIGANGLPERITSTFNGSVTSVGAAPREILAAPMKFTYTLANGEREKFGNGKVEFQARHDSVVEWVAEVEGAQVLIYVHGQMEADGHLEFRCTVGAGARREVATQGEIALEIPRTTDTAKYAMGLGYYGGAAKLPVDWKWDVKKHQDALWMGDVNAGLRVHLRAENYARPMVNIHYGRQPLNDPPSWSGGGVGGIKVAEADKGVLFRAYSGPRVLEPGKLLHFHFDLSVTPFKPLNTEAQWRDRYYQGHGMPSSPEEVRKSGANIVNIHQGNALNPYINYPFLTADKLADYTTRAHALGLRVKYYYTVRELTNWTPELFAMRAFGNELIAPGKGGGHAWCEEHLGGNYWGAWYEPGTNDASILTTTMSRFHNYYLEGLGWLVKNAGCDGIYLDDISYDRTVMKRARRILDTNPRGGLIDLHSWNELNGMAGYACSALIFMDSFPYVDRLWLGEGHHYDGPPEQTLVGVSGIPYGLMGEMLEGGGNPWLGLTFGMTARLGWFGNPQPVWKLWDDFGTAGSEFIGWWDPANPVKASAPECRATIWRHKGRVLVAVGNFGDKPVSTTLAIDFAALGLNAQRAHLYAPEMKGFQPELLFATDARINIAPKRAFAFILDETPRQPVAAPAALAFDRTKILWEEKFVPQPKDGWKITASKRAESVKPDKEGLVFLAPANTHAWAEHPLPADAAIVAAQIRQDSNDSAQQWGPGVALVWPGGKILKAGRRSDGRFGLSVGGAEKLAGNCDIERPVTIAFLLEKERIRIVASGEGVYQQDQELARIPRAGFEGAPIGVRLGKMPNSGEARDNGDPGLMGWSRADWLRIYR